MLAALLSVSKHCDFTGAKLEHADLTDAMFDRFTLWPDGFDPREHGAT